jgi:hypothetical protein
MVVAALVDKEDLAHLSNERMSVLERILVREILEDKQITERLASKLRSAAKKA